MYDINDIHDMHDMHDVYNDDDNDDAAADDDDVSHTDNFGTRFVFSDDVDH